MPGRISIRSLFVEAVTASWIEVYWHCSSRETFVERSWLPWVLVMKIGPESRPAR